MDKQTSKTLGQKICEARAQKNISQTELAEALDVSRQSISKWETDAALPEIDKLIALSRYFAVPIGALLGLEDEPASEPTEGGELSETQLKMVQEIVDRYLAAQPKPMSKKRRTVLKIAVCVAAVCLAVGLSRMAGQLKDLNRQYDNLQYAINNVTNGVNHQISGISGRVEELLKQQNNLTADYETEIKDIDVRGNMVTFSFRAVPKTFTEGMTAWLEAENGTAKFTFGPFEPVGQTFSGEATFALTDDISLYIVFETDGKRETQLLDEYFDLWSYTMPWVSVVDWIFADQLKDGKLQLAEDSVDLIFDRFGLNAQYRQYVPAVAEYRVGLFRNKTLVCWLSKVEEDAGEDQQIFLMRDVTKAEGCDLTEKLELPVQAGDEVCYAVVLKDEAGRSFISTGGVYSVIADETGKLNHSEGEDGIDKRDIMVSDPAELAKWKY